MSYIPLQYYNNTTTTMLLIGFFRYKPQIFSRKKLEFSPGYMTSNN